MVEGFGTSTEQCLFQELEQVPEQAGRRGDALSTLNHHQQGLTPVHGSKPSPAACWQVQMLSGCTLASNKHLN